jgi:hypothetical protein
MDEKVDGEEGTSWRLIRIRAWSVLGQQKGKVIYTTK